MNRDLNFRFFLPSLATLILFAAFFLVTLNCWSQATYYSRQTTGDWTSASTWSTASCGGTAATTTPGITDNVVICTGHTVRFNSSAHTTIANLTIEASGVLTINVGRNLTVNSVVINGNVNGGSGGDIRVGNAPGSTISGTGTFNTTSNNTQLRLLSNVSIPAGTDLKFNDDGRFHLNGFVATNNGKITIGSNSTFAGGGTFVNAASSYLLFSRQGNWPNATTLTASATGNTVEFAATTNTRLMDRQGSYYHLIISNGATKQFRATSVIIRGNLTINNGATLDTNTGARTISIAGNWINNLGGTFNENASLVTFNGSANNQTLAPPAGTPGEVFYDLTINNTFPGGDITASGNVAITAGRTLTMTSGIFNMQTYTLSQSSGTANLSATGGDLRLAKVSTTLPELAGSYAITGGTITFNGASGTQSIRSLNSAPANYHNITLGGGGTKTLVGDITVAGNWTNSGVALTGNYVVSFAGTGTQTITNSSGQTFYSATVNTTGPLTLAVSTNVTVNNTLTMLNGNVNLNGQTITVGNAGASTLTRSTGICYAGTFRRYFPATPITSTSGSYYGLFPIGTSASYRPVQINSTTSPTTPGYVSVSHTDATTATDVSYNDNEGTAIQRVTDMRSNISTATLNGGVYTLSVAFTTLSSAGLLSELKLETLTGPPYGVGTSDPTTGSVANPVGIRRLLSETNLNKSFVMGTTNKSSTPLVSSYYSRRTGNWNDATAGNATWSRTDGGPTCDCTPTSSSIVYINPTHTVTVNVTATTDFLNVRNGATLDGSSNLTVNYDLQTIGTGRITPTSGAWIVGRNLTIAGTSTSTSSATLAVASNLQIDASNSLTLNTTATVAGNLTVNGTLALGSTTMTLSGTGVSISGTNGVINGSSGTIALTNAKTIASGSTLSVQPTLSLSASTTITNQGSVTTSGNISGTNATSIWTNIANSSLTTTGANLLSTGILNANAAPNTITYSGSGAQAVKAPASSYYNLIIANAGTKTVSGGFSVTNLLTIQDAAKLNVGANQLNGAGGLTMSGTSELIISRAVNTTYPELTGTYSLTGGTITFSPASNTYTLRPIDYYNLTLSGTGSSSFDFSSGPHYVENAFVFNCANSSSNNQDLTVGSLTLTSGTFTVTGTRVIEITGAGGWTQNGGTFNPSANTTILFSGSSDQSIGGSVATTFTKVELSNSGTLGVVLNQDMTVSEELIFTGGNLVTSVSNILSMPDGAVPVGANDDSFVSGPVQKIGNNNFEFPVGDDGAYRPIAISSLSGSGTFRGEYFHADPNGSGYNTSSKDASLTRINTGEYWLLDRTAGTPTAIVTLSWDAYSGIVDQISTLRIARWDGTSWRDVGNGANTGSVSPGTGTISTTAAVASFSPFTLAASNTFNPLPIELLEFTGKFLDEDVLLSWRTATEINNDFFAIEKSKDGRSFREIGKVDGAGTTAMIQSYQFTDSDPYLGLSYYRLRQTDFDGEINYSNVVVIDNRRTREPVIVEAYPNPAFGEAIKINVRGLQDQETIQYSFMDNKGQVLIHDTYFSSHSGKFDYVIDTRKLSSGVYLFTISSRNGRQQIKILVI